MMLRLDRPPNFYSEQIFAGFRMREYTTAVEGAQERICVDLPRSAIDLLFQEPVNLNGFAPILS